MERTAKRLEQKVALLAKNLVGDSVALGVADAALVLRFDRM